jgi:hypothetical protein
MRHEISPSAAARHCVENMRAFFAETNTVKAEEIATLQLQALREHIGPQGKKLRLSDVKEMFIRMRDDP